MGKTLIAALSILIPAIANAGDDPDQQIKRGKYRKLDHHSQ